jgi:hypothetical protein
MLALLGLVGPALAQFDRNNDEGESRGCETVEHNRELRAKYPFLGTDESFEYWISDKIDEYLENPTEAITTIPLVIHVIHNGEAVGSGSNLSATYINAQVDQLNNDFGRIAGTSGSNTHPDGADTEVRFTAVINRVNRNTQGWTAPPYSRNYFESTIKPQTYWDTSQYGNIYIGDLSGGLLGYAQFPSQSGLGGLNNDEGPANTDGVVCLYTSVGSTVTPNPGGGIYAAGRTMTHEIGHWLGLRHIWGDGGCGVDDFVADTPESDASNFNCPTGHVSCGTTDMIENYMDYTQDTCMNIYTNGQKARIQAVLANALRRQWGGGPGGGCSTTVSSFPYSESFESGLGAWSQGSGDDIDWTRDSGGTPSSGTGPSAADDGSWYMYVEASSPNYPSKTAILDGPCFDLSGETSATFEYSYHMYGAAMGTLALQASDDDGATWTTVSSISGDQGNSWSTDTVNLNSYAGDTVQLRFVGTTGSNYTSDMTIDSLSLTVGGGTGGGCTGGITSYPYSESFESGLGAWSQASGDDLDWTRDSGGTPSSSTGPSAASNGTWYMYVEASSPNYPSKTAILNGPCFNLSGQSAADFSFDYHMYGAAMGSLSLQASTDGSTWSTEWVQSGNQGNGWLSANVDLSAYLGSNVQVRFVGVTGSSYTSDMTVDNINMSTSGSGGGTTNLTLTITFDNYPEETSWEILDGATVVASGGTYGSEPDGSTKVINVTVADGCYDFVIYDSYGDGICCSYGSGSYNLSDSGGTLASGGSFGSSETTAFCVP